jgi:hypothetical protein
MAKTFGIGESYGWQCGQWFEQLTNNEDYYL